MTVLGAGRTGQAVARFLAQQKARVFLSDQAPISPPIKRELESIGVEYEEGDHTERALQAELIVPSPGVPYDAPLLAEARKRGIPILGELELAYRFCQSGKMIAITGTVGKTTTTHLISELLRANGHHTVVAGNFGQPLTSCLGEIGPETVVVLEVSSFQLEHVDLFKPHIGVFTHFAPHHLDRHGSLEDYFAIKCRLFARQQETDFAVIHHEIRLPCWVRARILRFSAEDLKDLNLNIAPHQREDLAGALLAVRLLDPQITLRHIDIEKALKLPHRLEFVAEVGGVRFYNDSKATSIEATLAALKAFPQEMVLILGGYDEGAPFKELAQEVFNISHKLKAVFLLGQTREHWAHMLEDLGYRRFHVVRDLHEAIAGALRVQPRLCLFSPAAPSFDQFKSYEERGEHFKQIIRSYLS